MSSQKLEERGELQKIDKATGTLERSTTHAMSANRDDRGLRRHWLDIAPLASSIMARKTRHATISIHMLIK